MRSFGFSPTQGAVQGMPVQGASMGHGQTHPGWGLADVSALACTTAQPVVLTWEEVHLYVVKPNGEELHVLRDVCGAGGGGLPADK
eukprot:gene20671-27461_t